MTRDRPTKPVPAPRPLRVVRRQRLHAVHRGEGRSRTQVPPEYVKNGEIMLNIGPNAVHKLQIGNELIEFSARFGGVAREISVPVPNVYALYARETGHGMTFDVEGRKPGVQTKGGEPSRCPPTPGRRRRCPPPTTAEPPKKPSGGGKPTLRRIK